MDKKHEFSYSGLIVNGFLMLVVWLLILGACILGFMTDSVALMVICGIVGLVSLFIPAGLFMLEPNESIVTIFFGKYCGTIERTGYWWINPLMTKKKVSLRIRNLDVQPIKVNDKVGNPILIGLVLVWRIKDTYRVTFDLDKQSVAQFVSVQSDAALREVAGRYPYDSEGHNDTQLTLRSGGEEINAELVHKLNERLAMAGIEVTEARINYLAYAPEIAAVMLRRQQASAIISAREKIVEGAVTMVKMALDDLERHNVVKLDNDHRAAMVGNLLVVLCADEAATPVVNTNS